MTIEYTCSNNKLQKVWVNHDGLGWTTDCVHVHSPQLDNLQCKKFKRLASAIGKYGHMYYHFIHGE